MKVFKVNRNIAVVCQSENTRYGFRHLATLIYKGNERGKSKCCYYNRTWERYTFESVLEKLAEENETLSIGQTKTFQKYIKNYDPMSGSGLRTIAMVAKMGDVLGKNKKERNDWKTRMIKAGLEKRGLIMPDNWNKLSEEEKQTRLDKVIKQLET